MREIMKRDCSTCKYFNEEYSESCHCDGCIYTYAGKYNLPIVGMKNWESEKPIEEIEEAE